MREELTKAKEDLHRAARKQSEVAHRRVEAG
jgi:hypothetical protein